MRREESQFAPPPPKHASIDHRPSTVDHRPQPPPESRRGLIGNGMRMLAERSYGPATKRPREMNCKRMQSIQISLIGGDSICLRPNRRSSLDLSSLSSLLFSTPNATTPTPPSLSPSSYLYHPHGHTTTAKVLLNLDSLTSLLSHPKAGRDWNIQPNRTIISCPPTTLRTIHPRAT